MVVTGLAIVTSVALNELPQVEEFQNLANLPSVDVLIYQMSVREFLALEEECQKTAEVFLYLEIQGEVEQTFLVVQWVPYIKVQSPSLVLMKVEVD